MAVSGLPVGDLAYEGARRVHDEHRRTASTTNACAQKTSEADYVIVALPHSRLLDPSWLYTAVTRARQQVIIVGQPEPVREALQRSYADELRTVGPSWV